MAFSDSYNFVHILGRIATDITPINNKSGETIGCRFNIACDRRQTEKTKDQPKQTDYIPCIAWAWVSKRLLDHHKKGDKVSVYGSWQSGNYTGRDGKKVYTNNCLVNEIHDMSSGNSSGGANNYKQNVSSNELDDILGQSDPGAGKYPDVDPDDLPF